MWLQIQVLASDIVFTNSLEKKVREIVHKAFWDCLEAQLNEDPPTYDHSIKLLGEVKEVGWWYM